MDGCKSKFALVPLGMQLCGDSEPDLLLPTGSGVWEPIRIPSTMLVPCTISLADIYRNSKIVRQALSGGDVVANFAREKAAVAEAEDDKVVDSTLPGWGLWVGDGVSKREKKRHQGRLVTTFEGVKKNKRQNTKLDRVIINEKRIKKLPYEFETKDQYERSLRLPRRAGENNEGDVPGGHQAAPAGETGRYRGHVETDSVESLMRYRGLSLSEQRYDVCCMMR
ncbi:hypothetical protein S40288_11217 [Stachybotrys chartarum IBT 40288]|nr:hypothetical protein S40288_11217 [Stachybotrys chartarum IBT 40288]